MELRKHLVPHKLEATVDVLVDTVHHAKGVVVEIDDKLTVVYVPEDVFACWEPDVPVVDVVNCLADVDVETLEDCCVEVQVRIEHRFVLSCPNKNDLHWSLVASGSSHVLYLERYNLCQDEDTSEFVERLSW